MNSMANGTKRLLCDEMLTGLGKWLRAAGYDTVIARPGEPDGLLLAKAVDEGRWLITRDRSMMERRGASSVVLLLHGNDMTQWVKVLNRELAIDWLLSPFSRCLQCNGLLQAGAGAFADQLPDYVQAENKPCFHCPDCQKAYWPGGHVERMQYQLRRWHCCGSGKFERTSF